MDKIYHVETKKALADAVEDVKLHLQENGFGTLFELNFKEKVKEKGFEIDQNFILLEVCNPSIASEILKENIEVGYVLPCKVVVYEKSGKRLIGLIKPTALVELVDSSFLDQANQIEKTLIQAINESV